MKKKIALIALIVLLVGGALTAIGLSLGAHTNLHWNGGFRVLDTHTERHEFNETLPAFRYIDLSVSVANVSLRHGDEYNIQGQFIGTIDFEVQDNRLIVNAQNARFGFQIGFIGRRSSGSHVTITVPQGTTLEDVRMKVDVGNINTQAVNMIGATIHSDVGNVTVTGDLTGPNNIQSAVGNVRVEGLLTGENTVRSDVGNVTLRLTESRDRFTYSGTADVGNLTIDGERQGSGLGGSVSHTAVDPLGTIRFDSGVGNVVVNFVG